MADSVVVATRMRLRSVRFLPAFLRAANGTAEQARQTPGFLGGALRIERGLVFWTLTVWDTGRAMAAFRDSGLHGMVMGNLAEWASEGSFALWRQDGSAVPQWAEVGDHLSERVRQSKVRHPSPAHTRGDVLLPHHRAIVVRSLSPKSGERG